MNDILFRIINLILYVYKIEFATLATVLIIIMSQWLLEIVIYLNIEKLCVGVHFHDRIENRG